MTMEDKVMIVRSIQEIKAARQKTIFGNYPGLTR